MPADVSFDELALWISFAHLGADVIAHPAQDARPASWRLVTTQNLTKTSVGEDSRIAAEPTHISADKGDRRSASVVAAPVLIAMAASAVSNSESAAVATAIEPSVQDTGRPLAVKVEQLEVEVGGKSVESPQPPPRPPQSPTSGCTCSIH